MVDNNQKEKNLEERKNQKKQKLEEQKNEYVVKIKLIEGAKNFKGRENQKSTLGIKFSTTEFSYNSVRLINNFLFFLLQRQTLFRYINIRVILLQYFIIYNNTSINSRKT